MQKRTLHRKLYHARGIDETAYSEIVFEREKKLKMYDKLIVENCSQPVALEAIGISRATLYRWKERYREFGLEGLEDESRSPIRKRKPTWGPKEKQYIVKLRRQYPIWGKIKIQTILKRDYRINISASTVGRIIKNLVEKGMIQPVHHFDCCVKIKRKRVFSGYAQRWQYGTKSEGPGQLIQVDHMTVKLKSAKRAKHFNAICPFTRYSVGQAYGVATSDVAAKFLDYLQEKFPFQIISIQVDGGSEFMGDFEDLCRERGIILMVLPPRRPQYNGSVERVNGTVKHEFYQFYKGGPTFKRLNLSIERYAQIYNAVRPHQALHNMTPLEYCQSLGLEGAFNVFA